MAIIKGTKVKHNFTGETGEVISIRSNPKKYNYLVRWDKTQEMDFYKVIVLEEVK